MEQLRTQNTKKIHLSRVLRTLTALAESEQRKREDNFIKDIKNIFRLRKEIYNSAAKDIRNLFGLKQENKTIKDKIIRDIKSLFEEDDYYKPTEVEIFGTAIIQSMDVTVLKVKIYQ